MTAHHRLHPTRRLGPTIVLQQQQKKNRVYSHNVNGLRDESKLEHIPRVMQQKNIDAYLIQETHLAGDFEKLWDRNTTHVRKKWRSRNHPLPRATPSMEIKWNL